MTTQEFHAILDHHGLKIDGHRAGAGKFRDLEIGVGASLERLSAFVADVKAAGFTGANLTHVTNCEHPDYPKPYAELPSFWWEENYEVPSGE